MPEYAKYEGWKDGENNILRSTELSPTQLRRCVNFDITDTGELQVRQGRSIVYNGSIQPRSFFSNGTRALFVESGHLWELYKKQDGTYDRILVRLNVGARAMTHLDVNGDIYWSNGVNTGIFTTEGEDLAWGIRSPHEQPTVIGATSGGRLTAGVYQVAMTFVSDRGEESGTPLAKEITLPEGTETGSIVVQNIPLSTEADTVRIYVSHPNGEGLYRAGEFYTGTPQFRITRVDNAVDIRLQTQFGIKPPAGDVLEYHNGRIYIAQGNVVWFTDPLRYGLVRPHTNFLMYPSEVTVMKAVADGIFICADKTYWVTNIDTSDFQQREVLPYGAVYGTGIDIPESDNVAWFSHDGMVIAGLEAQVSNIQEDRSAVSKFNVGAMMYRKSGGLRQIVATLGGGTQSAYLSRDYAALETARRGDAI